MFKYIVAALLISAVAADHCQEAWAPFHKADATETGVKIFHHFLEQHPQIKDDFPKFKNHDLAHLKELPAFKEHATKIFHVIDDAIMKHNWNDVEALSQFHHDLHITDKAKFNHFRASMMDVLHLDAAHKDDFNKCMDTFFHHLFIKF